jgi:hypothetical protein
MSVVVISMALDVDILVMPKRVSPFVDNVSILVQLHVNTTSVLVELAG